jgi:hypothetical protein
MGYWDDILFAYQKMKGKEICSCLSARLLEETAFGGGGGG